jgi:nitrate/nitrite-specific signal transduction histidine kinase
MPRPAIVMRIAVDAAGLLTQVRDDGVRRAAQAFEAATAYGVMGMRERARTLAASWRSSATAGQGTLPACRSSAPEGRAERFQ